MKTFDVLGIAGILPLDHTYFLTDAGLVQRALKTARATPREGLNPPQIGVPFESYQRSGGGRIANILAYLGAAGEQVTLCGAVGDDEVGRLVAKDLNLHHVDTGYIRTSKGHNTRVVVVVTASGKSEQLHLKQLPLARFLPNMLCGLPSATIVLVGRANRSAIDYVEKANVSGHSKPATKGRN